MTITLTTVERGDLAERMIPIAAALTCVVHGDGDRQAVAHILNQLDSIERDALIVVLAGLVDPEQALGQALGYLTWDEHGAPTEPPATARTIRQAAALIYPPTEEPTRRTAEIVEDTALLVTRGLNRSEIASSLKISWGYVQQAHSREGVRIPEVAGW